MSQAEPDSGNASKGKGTRGFLTLTLIGLS